MASGLPVIVSNRCGCVPELLEDGKNGFSFAPEDVDELAELLLRIAVLPDVERQRMASESQRIIASWSAERFATGLRDAIQAAECVPRRERHLIANLLLSLLILARPADLKISRRAPSQLAPANS
jgi:hypothetical protein